MEINLINNPYFRTMGALNYKHLHYFWVVAKAGGVGRAAERLHLTPQSISGQLKLLEESLGGALFRRAGRRLELTDAGRVALAYAEEIFPRGDELQAVLTHQRGVPKLLRDLLAELAVQRLDVVIADAPMPREMEVRAFSHLLGTCGVSFFAAPAIA